MSELKKQFPKHIVAVNESISNDYCGYFSFCINNDKDLFRFDYYCYTKKIIIKVN